MRKVPTLAMHRGLDFAPNHKADLAILTANPLHDIRNTQTLSGVVVRGHYIDEQERQHLLNEVAHNAATTSATTVTRSCPCPTG